MSPHRSASFPEFRSTVVAFDHCVLGKFLFVVVLVGLPLSLFALLLWMAKRISGWGIYVSPFVVFLFVFVLCF